MKPAAPLVIGDTVTINSKELGEMRRINIYGPPGYAEAPDKRFPVLYMPDGGMAEDFIHVAGLIQVSVSNATMRPFILVGIENTERRRDLTGPTENVEDGKIAPRVGGSEAFRKFVRTELKPEVKARYRTTEETAVVGESLAGLWVVETLLFEPDLFDSYLAFDPSLWWNKDNLLKVAPEQLMKSAEMEKKLYIVASSDMGDLGQRFADIARRVQDRNFIGTTKRCPKKNTRRSTIRRHCEVFVTSSNSGLRSSLMRRTVVPTVF